jgi:hypothetical protein
MKIPGFLSKIRLYFHRRLRALGRLDCFLVKLSESEGSFSTQLQSILSLLNANRVLVEEVRELRMKVDRIAEVQATEKERWDRLYHSNDPGPTAEEQASEKA